MNKTILISAMLLLAAVAVAPTASAVDPCKAYGACVDVSESGVTVGDCQTIGCVGVYWSSGQICYGVSYQVPQCTPPIS